MKPNTFHLLTLLLISLLNTSAIQAAEFRSRATGDWSSYLVWERLHPDDPPTWQALISTEPVPTTSDTVTIRAAHTVEVSDARAAATILVEGQLNLDDGVLTVNSIAVQGTLGVSSLESGTIVLVDEAPSMTVEDGGFVVTDGVLRIEKDSEPPAIDVEIGGHIWIHNDGQLDLAAEGLTLEIYDDPNAFTFEYVFAVPLFASGFGNPSLKVSADATIAGTGTVFGNVGAEAEIRINAAGVSDVVTLQNNATIRREFDIRGIGSGQKIFDNRGLVNADDAAFIRLASNLSSVVDTAGSCSNPRWRVSHASGTLQFDKSATTLAGDFAVGPGTLNVNANVSTSGLLKLLTVGAVVPSSATFNVTGTGGVGTGNHYCSGSNCSSASFPYSTTVSCP